MRSVVVTGAASGIGLATCAELQVLGWRVLGVDLQGSEIAADLSTVEGRASMVGAVRERLGDSLDAVVACAGLAGPDWTTLAVNYFGAVATLEGLRPLLANGRHPRAVAVGSLAATMPTDPAIVEACLAGDEGAAKRAAVGKGPAIYPSSKLALTRWARQQAITADWAGAGILLNVAAPGLIETPLTQALIEDPAALRDFQQAMPMPVGHHGHAREVAKLVAFLIRADTDFIVGQVIFIDGGSEATLRGDLAW